MWARKHTDRMIAPLREMTPPPATPSVFGRWVLAGVFGGCLVVGGTLLWVWLNPDRLSSTTPLHLFGLLGLFVLPSATMAFLTIERRNEPAEPDPGAVRHAPREHTPRHRHARMATRQRPAHVRRHRVQR